MVLYLDGRIVNSTEVQSGSLSHKNTAVVHAVN